MDNWEMQKDHFIEYDHDYVFAQDDQDILRGSRLLNVSLRLRSIYTVENLIIANILITRWGAGRISNLLIRLVANASETFHT